MKFQNLFDSNIIIFTCIFSGHFLNACVNVTLALNVLLKLLEFRTSNENFLIMTNFWRNDNLNVFKNILKYIVLGLLNKYSNRFVLLFADINYYLFKLL